VTRDAPPGSPAASGGSRELAPLVRRYASLGYEGLVAAALLLLVGFATVPFVSPVTRDGPAFAVPGPAGRALSAFVVLLVLGVYFAWSWTGGRRTLPMKTWRMSLVRSDGRPVDARSALTRYLAAWIGPMTALAGYLALESAGLAAHAAWLIAFNFLWAFIDPERQFLHDRIAGTRIVTTS
jgi:uncharacterized RDD family membrane protein YckC